MKLICILISIITSIVSARIVKDDVFDIPEYYLVELIRKQHSKMDCKNHLVDVHVTYDTNTGRLNVLTNNMWDATTKDLENITVDVYGYDKNDFYVGLIKYHAEIGYKYSESDLEESKRTDIYTVRAVFNYKDGSEQSCTVECSDNYYESENGKCKKIKKCKAGYEFDEISEKCEMVEIDCPSGQYAGKDNKCHTIPSCKTGYEFDKYEGECLAMKGW